MKVIGFSIYDSLSGDKIVTLPLTIPIGDTVEAYEKEGQKVFWGWEEEENE
jgi:hypothetical protein